jgi:putative redox protein
MPVNQVSVRWQGQMRFDAHSHPDQVISIDAAPKHGGHEEGTRPMDLLLVGLAGCTAMDVMSILQKKRQPITNFEVRVSGERAGEHPKVFTEIDVLYIVEGESVDPRAVERAMNLSETKYCSAWAMLSATANVTSRYEIRQPQVQQ